MIAISGLFSALFLSPFLFAAAMIVAAIVGGRRHRRAATWLLASAAALLLIFSMPAVSGLLLRPLEYRYPPIAAAARGIGAVVVLGAGVRNGAPDEGGQPTLSETALKRVVAGFLLSRKLDVPVVVSGGITWADRGTKSEAAVARDLLVKLGTPVDRVHVEETSRTTRENARNVAVILREMGVTRIALVTSASHMPRAMKSFARSGVDCIPAPTGYLSADAGLSPVDLLPAFGALRDSSVALREYFGLVLYAAAR
jgi:uncharacterized SAM-binding protein YcdF (DUF218 family)